MRLSVIVSFLFAVILLPLSVFGQSTNYVPMDAVPVEESGITLANPFAGGINLPQVSGMDLNGDAFPDLVVFDNAGFRVMPFVNTGATGTRSYAYAPEYAAAFPQGLEYLLLMRDYNCDGKEDIFTLSNSGLKVYRNTSSGGNLSFALAEPVIKSDFGTAGNIPIFVATYDIPAIQDVDGDGDLDIITFDAGGTYVEFHQNLSVENFGHCDSLVFILQDACWGKFFESGLSNVLTLNSSCKGVTGGTTSPQQTVHAGSSIALFDYDADGALDAFIGDLLFPDIAYAHNGGTSPNALMDTVEYGFPAAGIPADLYVFAAPFFEDVNNDGKEDFLVSAHASGVSVDVDNFWVYHNTGVGGANNFNLSTKGFLVDEMIDVGTNSLPVFFDHNGDGKMDLVVSNYVRKPSSSQFEGGLTLYENNGTASNPSFRLITTDYANISTFFTQSLFGLSAAFGDMDSDGDADLVLGDQDGKIHFFENTAGAGNTASFTSPVINWKGIDVGQHATPAIGDLNRDGKPDLLIGELGGTLNYFENIGTFSVPDFTNSPTDANFGQVDTDPMCCSGYSVPFLMENPVTTKWDLYVGTEKGPVWYYANIEANLTGAFPRTDSLFGNFDEGRRSAITGADIDNDGDIEWAIGNLRGGLGLFEPEVIAGVSDPAEADWAVRVFPNPSTGRASILADLEGFEVKVFDAVGKLCFRTSTGGRTADILLPEYRAGVYFVRVSTAKGTKVLRWVIQP